MTSKEVDRAMENYRNKKITATELSRVFHERFITMKEEISLLFKKQKEPVTQTQEQKGHKDEDQYYKVAK